MRYWIPPHIGSGSFVPLSSLLLVSVWGYNVAGNLVNNNSLTRTFNAANQMSNDGTNTLTYDTSCGRY
jgi:hypothetical protein